MNQFDTPADYAANLMRTHNGHALAAIEHVKATHGMGGQFWRDTVALLESMASARHFYYNTDNFPIFVCQHGNWAIYRKADGYCASIPVVAGCKATHFGDVAYVRYMARLYPDQYPGALEALQDIAA